MNDDLTATHHAALTALRTVARRIGPDDAPSGLSDQIAAADGEPRVTAMACTYLYAARVGGNVAGPDRAMLWVSGWSAARSRTPAEVQAALREGIRFAERLHRSLGIASG